MPATPATPRALVLAIRAEYRSGMDRAGAADVMVAKPEHENAVPSISTWTAAQEAAARERRLLMQAAIDVMAEHPDRSPRVSDIVARAGLSNSAFYRHFRSKDDLVLA